MRTAVWTDSISVLDRVTAVLEAFGEDEGLGVSEIARRANLPKSTVSRIVTDLVRERYLDREGNLLHLGLRLFELGQAVERPRRLRRLAHPIMTQLRDLTGETVKLAVLDGSDVVLIASISSREGRGSTATAGARTPAEATALGKAILAFSDDGADLDRDLRRELVEIRRNGIASNVDGAGAACVASAIIVAWLTASGRDRPVRLCRRGGRPAARRSRPLGGSGAEPAVQPASGILTGTENGAGAVSHPPRLP